MNGHLGLGVNAVAETNLSWDPADNPNVDFSSDIGWWESYLNLG